MQPGETPPAKPVSKPGPKAGPKAPAKPAPKRPQSSSQPILIFLAVAVVFFGVGLIYKAVHRHHGAAPSTEVASSTGTVKQATAVVAPKPVPVVPVVPRQADLLKQGVENPVFAIRSHLDELGPALQSAMNGQRITLADLDKLEFGSAGASTNPEYNIFNPNGKIRFHPYNGKWITQDVLDNVTGKKGTQIVYNMRRTIDSHGMPVEVLYALIPSILPENCGDKIGVQEYTVNEQLAIEPSARNLIQDPAGMPVIPAGCVKAPGQPLVWFYAIKLRTRAHSTDQWTSHAP